MAHAEIYIVGKRTEYTCARARARREGTDARACEKGELHARARACTCRTQHDSVTKYDAMQFRGVFDLNSDFSDRQSAPCGSETFRRARVET